MNTGYEATVAQNLRNVNGINIIAYGNYIRYILFDIFSLTQTESSFSFSIYASYMHHNTHINGYNCIVIAYIIETMSAFYYIYH